MKAYTYNDRLVGVGNDQILGTDQGGGSTYTAGNGIDITNDVISVDDTVALVSALPTTELGKFTIQSNVSGGPIEVICPTDQAPDTVFYQINSVSGNAYTSSYSYAAINYYYGESPADFNGSDDYILFTINDSISNIGQIAFYYTTAETGMGGPSLTTTSITGGSTGIVQSDTYRLKAYYNQAGTSGSYGKYLQIMFNWRNYATDAAQSLQWAQEALSKITFFGVVRPDATLGTTVNLDRYYLGGNIVSNKPTNSGLPAQIWLNPDTKKQEVYLPQFVPSSWNLKTALLFQYGSSSFGYSNADTSHDYIAYKYNSTTGNYEFAELVNTDYNAKKFTFARTYNGAIEYWIADCTNGYYSAVWSTETITLDMSEYIPYSASGVYLPNSKFEIDTEGQAYKVISAGGSETNYGSWNGDGSFAYGNIYTLPTRNADGTATLKAGTYRFTLPDTANSIKLYVTGNTAAAYNGMVIPATNHVADLIITEDLTFIPYSQGDDWININALTNSDGTGSLVYLSSGNSSAVYISPAVKEEYLTDGDLELNDNNQVTAIDGHELAGGGGSFEQVNSDWNAASGVAEILNKPTEIQLIAGANVQVEVTGASAIISAQGGGSTPTYSEGNMIDITNNEISVETTAGITDIQVVNALPGSPVSSVLYLIPET